MGASLVKMAAVDLGIQLLGASVSTLFKTDKLFDIVGSCTFILLARLGLHYSKNRLHHQIQTNLVTAWATRLGLFLLYRVIRAGGDRRLDRAKQNPSTMLMFWMIQGVWVLATLLPTLLNSQNEQRSKPTTRDYVGWGMWGAGFLIEIIADYQKYKFRCDPDNAGKFISHGLWSISRHPNYFGEILLWSGLFVSASTSLKGWQWASGISPIFVYYLLAHVSGVPLLEKSGLKRYGALPEYQKYIKTVPALFPFFGKP